jgi:hypothetical protein
MLVFKYGKMQRTEYGFEEYLSRFHNKDSIREDVIKDKGNCITLTWLSLIWGYHP